MRPPGVRHLDVERGAEAADKADDPHDEQEVVRERLRLPVAFLAPLLVRAPLLLALVDLRRMSVINWSLLYTPLSGQGLEIQSHTRGEGTVCCTRT